MKLRVQSKRKAIRQQAGSITAESCAALVVLLPPLFFAAFVCYEVAMAFMIYNALDASARKAAMALAMAYPGDNTYATSATKQQSLLAGIHFANMVVNPNQFTVTFPSSPASATWTNSTGNIPAVVVSCTYRGGQYGLPPFPNPDPLNLGHISLTATATAYLEQ
jgi:hypothetical protein